MMRKGNHTVLALLPILFSGCIKVGPDFVQPAPNMPDSYGVTEATLAGDQVQSDVVSSNWWEGFQDQMLVDLIHDAVRSNRDLAVAVARLNEARAIYGEYVTGLFPNINTSVDYRSNRLGESQVPGLPAELRRIDTASAGFDTDWEIDFFGRIRRAIESKEALEEQAQYNVGDALRIVASEVARNYVALRGYQRQLQVAQENAANQEETVRLTTVMERVGRGTELDTARARAQLERTRSLIPQLESSIEATIHRVSVLLGENPNSRRAQLIDPKPVPRFSGPPKLGKPEELLRRRPDIRAAEQQLASATADIGLQIGGYFPKISFVGDISVEADTFSGLSESGAEAFSYGPSLRWEILRYNTIRQRVAAATARAEGAYVAYEQSVFVALEDAENSLVRFTKERERWRTLSSGAQLSRRAAEIANAQFQSGSLDFLSVLQTQLAQLAAEYELAESDAAVSLAVVGIYKALGGGWEELIPNEG